MLESLFPQQSMTAQFPIDLKKLHMALGVDSRWNDWFKRRVDQFGWTQGVDFTVLKNEYGGHTEVKCTLDMAKELGMIERSAQGAAIRKYFLQCEKELKQVRAPSIETATPHQHAIGIAQTYLALSDLWHVPKHYAVIESSKEIRRVTGIDTSLLALKSAAVNFIDEDEIMLEPTELAPLFGQKSGAAMNSLLESAGLQEKVNGQWEATEDGQTMSARHAWVKGTKSGYNLKWNKLKLQQWLNHD